MTEVVQFKNLYTYRSSIVERMASGFNECFSHKAVQADNVAVAYNLPSNGAQSGSNLSKVETDNMGKTTDNPKPVVLHVEDNPEIRFLVKMLLRKEYNVISFESGEDAVEHLEQNGEVCDLILMDINLGRGMSGIETSKKIRAELNEREIPIIALTANNYHDLMEECAEAGINGFIQKPFDKSILLETIGEFNVELPTNGRL